MAEYLACFETELSSEVFELFVLYSQENYVLKGNLCIHCMWTFHSRFIPFETLVSNCMNRFTSQLVLRELLWSMNLCVLKYNCSRNNFCLLYVLLLLTKWLKTQSWGWDYSIQVELFYMWCFSHYMHHFCEDVGTFYRTFTFRFSFWAHFHTQLMNIIWKYV